MTKKKTTTAQQPDDDMLAEYDFTGKKGVRGKYAQANRQGHVVRVYDEEGKVVDLRTYSIDEAQADQLRVAMETFVEDWDSPEMDAYDDYDAARSRSTGSTAK